MVRNRQIGWSDKTNMLWKISKQLDRLSSVFSKVVINTTPPVPPIPLGLRLTFDNIVNVPVESASSLANWNNFFDLPTNGTPFTSVIVDGNTVNLYGGSNIHIKDELFKDNQNLLGINDGSSCIVSLGLGCFRSFNNPVNCVIFRLPAVTTCGNYCFTSSAATTFVLPNLITAGRNAFQNCDSVDVFSFPKLTTAGQGCFMNNNATSYVLPLLESAGSGCFESNPNIETFDLPSLITTEDGDCFYECESAKVFNLPNLATIGYNCFYGCILAETIYIPSCTDLGGSTGDDYVFDGISGQTITLTIPSSLMTCDGGDPDGDIVYLQANNTVTIVTV